MTPLILASASPIRARLLEAAGIEFRVLQPALDEATLKRAWLERGNDGRDLARRLAREKAVSIAAAHPEAVVVGADQVLLVDGAIIGKCATEMEAAQLLSRLRGRWHELVTAAALAGGSELLWEHSEICRMKMRDFSDGFLHDYLSRAGDALTQCVGCYKLEGLGAQLFERIEGDYFSILGLPLLSLLEALRRYELIAA
jgi:septum formation protein